jgi:PAS domain-containing protein
VATSKAIQMILARQLASCVAMPILLVDADGTLIFYNEPAEALLNHRFDETGEIPADEWNRFVTVAGEDRKPLLAEDRPMWVARLQRKPVSRTMWIRSGEGGWRHVQVTAFPLVGEAGHMLGVMSLFWEV